VVQNKKFSAPQRFLASGYKAFNFFALFKSSFFLLVNVSLSRHWSENWRPSEIHIAAAKSLKIIGRMLNI